jgi:hypothetical protein
VLECKDGYIQHWYKRCASEPPRRSRSKKTAELTHPDPDSGNRGRHLRTPPTQPRGSAAGAGLRRTPQPRRHRCEAAASVGYAHAPGGEATMAKRGAWRLDGGARRVGTIAPSSPSPVLLGRRPTSPCNAPTLPCHRARRGGVGDAGGIEPACTDAPDGAPPPWRTQRRTRHRRMTTVSSTSGGFHRRRRRRRLLRGRQAEGRGTTFGAGCAARRAASAPSPPHLHSTRAHSAPSIRAARAQAGQSLRVRAKLLRSARASRRAAKGAGRSMANGEMVGEQRRPPTRLEPAAAGRGGARIARSAKKR